MTRKKFGWPRRPTFSTESVITDKTRSEHNESALPLKGDVRARMDGRGTREVRQAFAIGSM
jgi:hypothetical protein